MAAVKIRRGITRTVFVGRRWVVKVPTLRWGMWGIAQGTLANLSERDWSSWPGVCPQRRSFLGGMIAVYPRCEPFIPPDPDADVDEDWFRQISPDLPGCDAKYDNIGVLNGAVVWIDYASPWNGCPHSRQSRTGSGRAVR